MSTPGDLPQVPFGPQLGDAVEVRIRGTVVAELEDGRLVVETAAGVEVTRHIEDVTLLKRPSTTELSST